MAGEKKFGTSMFGFKRSDVNAYIERIIREFDHRMKEKDDENSTLKAQVKELNLRYDQVSQEAESLIREKEKIAGVLIQAQEKAETMMSEAQDRALNEKMRLEQLLESEKEKFVDIKREIKALKGQIVDLLTRYTEQIDETVTHIESREILYSDEGNVPEIDLEDEQEQEWDQEQEQENNAAV